MYEVYHGRHAIIPTIYSTAEDMKRFLEKQSLPLNEFFIVETIRADLWLLENGL